MNLVLVPFAEWIRGKQTWKEVGQWEATAVSQMGNHWWCVKWGDIDDLRAVTAMSWVCLICLKNRI